MIKKILFVLALIVILFYLSNESIAADNFAPTYSLNSTNATLVGSTTEFRLKWSGNVGLSGYIFSFDNCTGTFENSSFNSFDSVQGPLFQGPLTVGNSTSIFATTSNIHRKIVYDGSRYWLFFSNWSNYTYRYSSDLVTWSQETIFWNNIYGRAGELDVEINGSKIYVTSLNYTSPGGPYKVLFNNGTISGTTITWGTLQTLFSDGSYHVGGGIERGTDGRLMVVYHSYSGGGVYASTSVNDGSSWSSTTIGSLSASTSTGGVSIVKMGSGKFMAFAKNSTNYLHYSIWNGAAWGTLTSMNLLLAPGFGGFSAVSDGDTVYLSYLKSTNNIAYKKYNGTAWEDEITVQSGVTSTSFPVLSINSANGNLYMFWAGSPTANHIYYKKYNGTWDSSPNDWITETGLSGNGNLSSSYMDYGNVIGIMYMNSTSSPYQVRFASINFTFQSWSNTTRTINSTPNCNIRWRIYANDTSNNWNASEEYTFLTESATIFMNLTSSRSWWNDLVTAYGRAVNQNGDPLANENVNLRISNVQCNNVTDYSGYWWCTFNSPKELGTYTVEARIGSIFMNTTSLTVALKFGETPIGKRDRVVYEQPMIIQEPSGKIRIVWTRILIWRI